MKFIILGLPRSRTAWLAGYLSDQDSRCSHEGAYYKDWGEGDSTTVIPDDMSPFTKVIVIDRNLDDVMHSVNKLFGEEFRDMLTEQYYKLSKLRYNLKIPYKELNDNLQSIWELVKNTPFSNSRAEYFKMTHIENNEMIEEIKSCQR